MKFTLQLSTLFLLCCAVSFGQVPSPGQTGGNTPYTKKGEMEYEVRGPNGAMLTNVMDLKFLSTSTLSVLDKTNRTIYLLEGFDDLAIGSMGNAKVLATNVEKDFYVTNPNSFANYVNDEYVSTGKFTNVNGSYIYYYDGTNSTYYLDGIRNFSDWGAKSTYKLPYSESNTYWTRIADKGTYHIIKKGKTLDYTNITTEQSGNDMLVKDNGTYTYKLPAYYTTASYVYKPVEKYTSSITNNTNTTTAEGCVKGDCQDGWGKYQYEGGYYDGFWVNGKKDGYGLYKWKDVGKYIGDWSNDQMNGYGVYIALNEDNIVGWYVNGQLNGVGYSVTGDKWEQGIYSNGNLTTPYTYYSNNVETGCVSGDCENKYGKYKWENGDTFVGFFKGGSMYLGSYTFSNGDKYSGTFNAENQFDGFGRYFYTSGGYYGGEWVNGNYEGKGYYHDEDFKRQVGMWKNEALVLSLE